MADGFPVGSEVWVTFVFLDKEGQTHPLCETRCEILGEPKRWGDVSTFNERSLQGKPIEYSVYGQAIRALEELPHGRTFPPGVTLLAPLHMIRPGYCERREIELPEAFLRESGRG